MTLAPLPDGTILLHVGPHKTGTTALQYAAAGRRQELAAAGVLYPGTTPHHSRAAMALAGRGWGWANRGGSGPRMKAWDDLVAEATAAPGTVLISSEFFDEVVGERIDRGIRELGRDRVHVVVTLRPLAKILPSSWQQYLKYGLTPEYGTWLEETLHDPPIPNITPSFWVRQDHGDLVERWAGAVGAERLTVVVVEDDNPPMMPTTFEQLLGLPAGLLAATEALASNRSMSWAECELIRRTNDALGRADVDWTGYEKLMRYGAILRMVETRTPAPDERRVALPHWARVRTRELGQLAAERIAASGVRVVGDLGRLAPDPGKPGTEAEERALVEPPTDVALEAAVEALVGSLSAGVTNHAYFTEERLAGQRAAIDAAEGAEAFRLISAIRVRDVKSSELLRVVADRVRNKNPLRKHS